MSWLGRAYLKTKSNSFLDVRTDRTTLKDDTRMPGITTTRPKPSAREKKAVYKISRMPRRRMD